MSKRLSKSKAAATLPDEDPRSKASIEGRAVGDQRIHNYTKRTHAAPSSSSAAARSGNTSKPLSRRPSARARATRNGSVVRKGPTTPATKATPLPMKRKGGLIGRLKSMRRKEAEDEDVLVSDSEQTTEVPATVVATGSAASPTKKPTSPSYPSPEKTLGISAFQRQRASTSPSAITGGLTNEDELDNTITPLQSPPVAADGRIKGKDNLRLKETETAKQPDIVEKGKARKSTSKRYSIAHSVEASIVGPSWSTADGEEGDSAEEDHDDDQDDEDEIVAEEYQSDDDAETDDSEESYTPSYWLKDDAGPPMVEGSVTSEWKKKQRAYEEDFDGDTTTTQQAMSHTPKSTGKGKKKKKKPESFYAAEVAGVTKKRRSRNIAVPDKPDDDDVEAHLLVNRLLAKLEADVAADRDDLSPASPAISSPVTKSTPTKNGADKRKSRGGQSTALFAPAIAPSVVYGGGDETLIMPDDSVSIRAAKRFAQQQKQASKSAQGTSRLAGSLREDELKPQTPQELAAAFEALEPAFIEDEDEDEEEDEEQDGLRDEKDDRNSEGVDDYTEYDEKVDDDQLSDTDPANSPSGHRRSRGYRSKDLSRETSNDTSTSSEFGRGKRISNRRRRLSRPSTELGRETWLMESALTPEQLHYLVKSMISVELEWELHRAFVFNPSSSPSSSFSHHHPPSRSREYAVFRKRELTRDDIPELPLLRFLYDTAFVMLPLFGRGQTEYGKRKSHADHFWKRAILPLLRIFQSRSFSQRLDRCGEGDRGPFSTQSTFDVLARTLHQAAVRFITATIRVGDEDVKEGWPWPSANMMRLPAFTPYRVPLTKQSFGAYEVNVIFVRPNADQTAYILKIKRNNGEPHHFVIRTEAQFREFANALSRALPKACIKPPPAVEMAQMPAHFRELIRTVDQATATGTTPDLPAPVATELKKLDGAASTAELDKRDSKTVMKSATASPVSEEHEQPQPKLGRIAALKAELRREIQQEFNRGKGNTNGHQSTGSRSNGGFLGRLTGATSTSKQQADRHDPPSRSESYGSVGMSPSTTLSDYSDSGPSSPTTDSRATLVDPPSYSTSQKLSFASLFGGGSAKRKDDCVNHELRRLQLRDWLRDALSARGVGHNSETRAFLSQGAFTDRDLKKSTKEAMEANRRADEESTRQRQDVASQAGEEVLDLRDMIDEMWEDCKFADGFLEAKAVFEEADSFGSLPEDYQGLVSFIHLKAARMLDGIFITGSHSAANFRRAKAAFKSVPWKLLMIVMNEPTGMMMNDLKRILTHPSFLTRMTGAIMDDDPRRVEEGLSELKRRLPSDYLRKLRRFVEQTPDDIKRIIRDQAEKSSIPLVAAILRGSDAPLLEGRHLQVIIGATKTYQALMDSEPTMLDIEMAARKSRDIGLILDLQHALRLYSVRRDGQHLRDVMRSSAFRASFSMLVQPLLDYVAKLHHRGQPLKEAIRTLRVRIESLLELIEALRSRVQDPARNLDALTTFLDSHAHDTVGIISALTPLFPWLHVLAGTVAEGSDDLAREWPLPAGSSSSLYPLEGAPLNNLKNIAESAWLKRIRQMEVCSRWIAGDLEADQDIQVLGGEGQQSRTRQIIPEEPLELKLDRRAFKPFIPGFREALSSILESR